MPAPLGPAFRQLSDRLQEIRSRTFSLLWDVVRDRSLTGDVHVDGLLLEVLFDGASDLATRQLSFPGGGEGLLLWMSTMTDAETVDEVVFGAISAQRPTGNVAQRVEVATFRQAAGQVLAGRVLVLAPGRPTYALEARGYRQRAISAPVLESVVRGPHEGFVEDLGTNISLVRRRLVEPRLRVEAFEVGALSHTQVRLLYMEGLTNDALVNEARRRLRSLSTTEALDTSYLEEAIEDDPYSPFSQIDFTERPDVVVASLTEGRFAILCDGTSNALIAPVTFWSFLQAADDYYQRYWVASFLRLLRLLLLFLALLMPALYIAATTFHQQMLPTKILLSIASQRANIAFPAIVEAFLMEVSLEILREAGLHLPQKLNTSISVVGALVIGQASVSAGLVSWPVVVIVSITAIANFALPRWSMALAVRLLRFALMILAAIFGLPGLLIGFALILTHLTSLRSFGVPYLAPVAPLDPQGLEDALVRMPHWVPLPRPRLLAPRWRLRVRPGHRPRPPAMGGTT